MVIDFLEPSNPSMVAHRLSGETCRTITIASEWSIDKLGVHNAITKALERRAPLQRRWFAHETKRVTERAIPVSLQGVTT
jgi:radical SAM superfamily enzyme